jgi:cytochrome P450
MPDLGPAVDEFLRLEGLAPGFNRTAMCDLSVRGHTIRERERVVLYFGAANRDPAEFTNRDQLDLDRTNSSSHLAFGAGPHYCPGAPLARLELKVAWRILLDRLANIRLDPEERRVAGGDHGSAQRRCPYASITRRAPRLARGRSSPTYTQSCQPNPCPSGCQPSPRSCRRIP